MSRFHVHKVAVSTHVQTFLVFDRRKGSPVVSAALCRSLIDDGLNEDPKDCLHWSTIQHEGIHYHRRPPGGCLLREGEASLVSCVVHQRS